MNILLSSFYQNDEKIVKLKKIRNIHHIKIRNHQFEYCQPFNALEDVSH